MGVMTSNMEGKYEGWLRLQLGNLDQTIILVPKQATTFWRLSVVFRLPGNELICIGAMEATRSRPLLQPSGLGQASRLRLSICGPRQSRPHRSN